MALAEVPFDLVEVKLAAPSPRPGTVAKADAIARLCASTLPFATVVAPAGYGKTTLLAKWAEAIRVRSRGSRSTAETTTPWCSCDTSRPRFTASNRSRPRCSRRCRVQGDPPGPSRVPRVGSALAALERPLVLVLDDLHAVANPSCLDVLAALFEYVPAGSQIAVASREVPALPLARWRAHGSGARDRRGGPPAGRARGQAAARSGRRRAWTRASFPS